MRIIVNKLYEDNVQKDTREKENLDKALSIIKFAKIQLKRE